MKKTLSHILLWTIALSILNSSIDIVETYIPEPAQPGAAAEYNEIESVVELVIDKVTDHEEKLPDNKDNDQKTVLKKIVTYDYSLPVKKDRLLSLFINRSGKHAMLNNRHALPAGFTTLFSPPPNFS